MSSNPPGLSPSPALVDAKIRAALERAASLARIVTDDTEDEGDRIYFASTNHVDWLRDFAAETEALLQAAPQQPAAEASEGESVEDAIRELIAPEVDGVMSGLWNASNATYRISRLLAGCLQPGKYLARKLSALQAAPQAEASEGVDELADVLVMTGCKDRAELEDMANIGRSFMERMESVVTTPGPFHGWTPADDPGELVFDMLNALEEAISALQAAPQAEASEGMRDEIVSWVARSVSGAPTYSEASLHRLVNRLAVLQARGQAGGVEAQVARIHAAAERMLTATDIDGDLAVPGLTKQQAIYLAAAAFAPLPDQGEEG